jgi:hypothetical protein
MLLGDRYNSSLSFIGISEFNQLLHCKEVFGQLQSQVVVSDSLSDNIKNSSEKLIVSISIVF